MRNDEKYANEGGFGFFNEDPQGEQRLSQGNESNTNCRGSNYKKVNQYNYLNYSDPQLPQEVFNPYSYPPTLHLPFPVSQDKKESPNKSQQPGNQSVAWIFPPPLFPPPRNLNLNNMYQGGNSNFENIQEYPEQLQYMEPNQNAYYGGNNSEFLLNAQNFNSGRSAQQNPVAESAEQVKIEKDSTKNVEKVKIENKGGLQIVGNNNNVTKKIGRLTMAERRRKIELYKKKRLTRNFKKKISYHCRKKVAEQRIRIKGRFIRKDEALKINALSGINVKLDTSAKVKEEIFNIDPNTGIAQMAMTQLSPKKNTNILPNSNNSGVKIFQVVNPKN